MSWEDMFDDSHLQAALDKRKAEQKAKADKYAKSESKLQKDVAKVFEDAGLLTIRINSSVQWTEHGTRLASYRIVNTNATAGLADIIVMYDGRAAFVEVKTPTGRQSATQVKFAETAARFGMVYVIVRSLDDARMFVRMFMKQSTQQPA